MMISAQQAAANKTPRNHWQRYGWLMSVIWLGFLYYPAASLARSTPEHWLTGLGWAALIAFAICYLAGFILGMRGGWHRPTLGVWVLFFVTIGCAALTIPAIGWAATSFLPFLMAYASYLLGPVAHWVVAGAAVAIMLLSIAISGEVTFILLGIIVMMLVVNSINVWLISRSIASEELRMKLAKGEERESLARDVHDLLGHSLTVVKLKADLALRMIDRDPAAAKTELEAISQLTAEAISGVRGTVTGLRSPGFAEQLAASRAAFESAGIAVSVSGDPTALSPAQSLPASWVLREATTNALRHSGAAGVWIEIAPGTLTVTDDGGGLHGPAGNGLRGMAERAAAAGAQLSVGTGDLGGTRVGLTW